MLRTSTERLWQAAILVALVSAAALVAAQTSANLRARGIASGYGYLGRVAGFEIAPGPLPYTSRDTYARALAAGLVNTLRVAAPGIAIAAAIGSVVGIARLSRLAVVAGASKIYVDIFRNTPLLLQLLFWYALLQALPAAGRAWHPLPGLALSNRGLFLFGGRASISPEFTALLIGLSTGSAAYIAENVRGGILAVDRGQAEAAAAIGLSRLRTLRLVILPQAMPVILPPTTNQFLSLTKNSSLAVAIGYPDLMSITNTTLNQTGQAIEAIALTMAVYLTLGFLIASVMHRLSRRPHVS